MLLDMQNPKLSYISLFSGAGVGCYGFTLEDFDCIATCEIIEKRLNVQKYNNKCEDENGYILGDLRNEETKERIFGEIKKWKHNNGSEDVTAIIATPPCQGMSVANHKKKENERIRNSLVVESILLVEEINPRFFIFENVKTFLATLCTDKDGKDKPIKEAIETNLSSKYNILYRVVNFKDYGVPSSRTRTLVVGVRKDIRDITPYDIMPEEESQITLKQAIGHLPSLNNIGEISKDDIYHNFRQYDERMLGWIKDLKEGQNAFENQDLEKRPHQIINGEIVLNVNKNGDKYRRNEFDKVGSCIHTRNDILASQSTIHPKDNRVFSIRELMIMMSIPPTFKWTDVPEEILNDMNETEKKEFLRKNEMNIRQSIGEAVPTKIFHSIARKIKAIESHKELTIRGIQKIIKERDLTKNENLIEFLNSNMKNYKFYELSRICEFSNSKRMKLNAYYTSQDVCFGIINDLPEAKNFRTSINILEPSVGGGSFIPLLIKKYKEIKQVNIDLIDLDKGVLEVLKVLLSRLEIPKNIKINFINEDFIFFRNEKRYDITVGNPPFGKVENKKILLFAYKNGMYNKGTNNIFSFFIEKALSISKYVAFITPKSLLSTPEFDMTRELISKKNIIKITDYGELAFDVLIETISFIIFNSDNNDNTIKIESYITGETKFLKQAYVMSKDFPYWLIYRDSFFDAVANKMTLGVFDVFRDREITKKITKGKGRYRVLKSRNLGKDGKIVDINGYDSYVDSLSKLQVRKFLNKDNTIIVPNLSYSPRAGFLPRESIVDGSLAILIPKSNIDIKVDGEDLKYYSTEEFKKFYRIARNYGTRSLNIDKNSSFFWGVLKNGN